MTKDEALKLALETLEYAGPSWIDARQPAITAIKEALAQHTWVGLTPEDTFEIGERLGLSDIAWVDLMQAIEAKLKAKNT